MGPRASTPSPPDPTHPPNDNQRNHQMKQRKDQTEEQFAMRKFALMVHNRRSIDNPNASLRATAKDIWRLCPEGYANFKSFYNSMAR